MGPTVVYLADVVHTGVVAEISSRLLRRIQLDFPHHARLVLDRLGTLDFVVVDSLQDPERMLAAVVRVAAGRLDRLEQAIKLASLDWRDLLVAADFAHGNWPTLLAAWLDDVGRWGQATRVQAVYSSMPMHTCGI